MRIATAKIVAAIGFIASIVSIIGWFGITPEMVGGYAYSVFYILLPFVLFFSGFAVGWWARWRMREARRQMDEEREMNTETGKDAEKARDIFLQLSPDEIDFLYRMFNEKGPIEVPYGDVVASLEQKGMIEGIGYPAIHTGTYAMALTGDTRLLMEKHRDVFNEVRSIKGACSMDSIYK